MICDEEEARKLSRIKAIYANIQALVRLGRTLQVEKIRSKRRIKRKGHSII